MKKILFISLIVLSLTGCAFLQSQKANFDACMADIDCKAQAESWQDRVETASVVIASGIPVPGAAAAPKVLGYLALGIAGLIGGSVLRKKKKEEASNVIS